MAGLAAAVWAHPWLALAVALTVLVALGLLVRTLWRAVRRALSSIFARPMAPGG